MLSTVSSIRNSIQIHTAFSASFAVLWDILQIFFFILKFINLTHLKNIHMHYKILHFQLSLKCLYCRECDFCQFPLFPLSSPLKIKHIYSFIRVIFLFYMLNQKQIKAWNKTCSKRMFWPSFLLIFVNEK